MSDHPAFDMDDVVVDFVGGLCAAMKTEHNVNITEQDLEEAGWDLGPLLNPIIGYSWWTWLRERAWLWSQFPAMPGAIGTLTTLRRQGYYLELITSKPEWAEYNVWRWLGKWRPPFNRVTIVDKDDNKADFTDAALLVDDKPSNCLNFIAAGRDAILFDRPHNRNTAGLSRAHNWSDVQRIITEYLPNGR